MGAKNHQQNDILILCHRTNKGGGQGVKRHAKKSSKHPRPRIESAKKVKKMLQLGRHDIVLPSLQDLLEAIEKSVTFKGKDASSVPLKMFLVEWKHLGKGWLKLLVPDCHGKKMKEYESNIAGIMSSILIGCPGNIWEDLVYAFGRNKKTLTAGCLHFRQRILAPYKEVSIQTTTTKSITESSPKDCHYDSTPLGRESDFLHELSGSKIALFGDDQSLYSTPIKERKIETPLTSNTLGVISKIGGAIMMSISSVKKTRTHIVHHTKQAFGLSEDIQQSNGTRQAYQEMSFNRPKSVEQGTQTANPNPKSVEQETQTKLVPILSDKIQAIDLLMAKIVAENNEMDPQIASLAVAILDEVKRRGNHGRIIPISYLVKSGYRTQQKVYIETLKPRNTKGSASRESKQHYIREKATQVMRYAEQICGNKKEINVAVIQYVIEGILGGSVDWREARLDTLDCIAVRELGGGKVLTNIICKLISGIEKLGNTGKLAPSQLKKKIGDEERKLQKVKYEQLELKTSKAKTGSCIFYYISGMPLLVERLISSSILDGTQADSSTISNFKNVHIFFNGVDKGGEDLIQMLRYGNRQNGNTGRHSIPIGVAEGAAEDESNLKKTVCSPGRMTFIQLMIDQKLHIFQLHFLNEATKMVDAKCICVEFVMEDSRIGFDPNRLEVQVRLCNDVIFENASSETIESYLGLTTDTENRPLPSKLKLDDWMLEKRGGRLNLCLTLGMIRNKKAEGGTGMDDFYIGCEVSCTVGSRSIKIYSFRFVEPVVYSYNKVVADCKSLICIPSEDGKMSTLKSGQSTCGVKYPCLRCLHPLGSSMFPEWMLKEYPELLPTDAKIENHPCREGINSNEQCFQRFQKEIGPDKAYTMAKKELPDGTRDRCFSVTNEPIQRVPLDLISGDPLHLIQGYTTHLTQEVANMLAAINGGGSVITKKEDIIKELKDLISELPKSGIYLSSKRHHASLKNERAKLVLQISKRQKDDDSQDNLLVQLQDKLQEMDDASECDSQLGYFGMTNRRIRGAKLFLEVLEGGEKKRMESMEEAEFLFLQSIRRYAGSFNKQHGSMELTNARGMKALEKRHEIHVLVCKAFSRTNADANTKVKQVMDWWLLMAGHLFEMGKMAKSQKRMDPEHISRLKMHCVKYAVGWRKKITHKNPVFWKMHVFECCFMNFVQKTGMSGRASSEGFENRHHVMGGLKSQLAPIVRTQDRVSKLSQRHQLFLLPGLHEKFQKFEMQATAQGERSPYSKRALTRNEEDVDILEYQEDADAPDGYFAIDDGAILEDKYTEVFAFYKRSQVPEEWHRPFREDKTLGNKAIHDSRYLE